MRLVVLVLTLLAAVVLGRADAAGVQSPPMVGFVWHYPFSEVGTDMLAASGANALMARCAWGAVQPDESTFDFSSIKRQIQAAEQARIKLLLLLEFNPFCAPEWLKAKCKNAGEATRGVDGSPGTMPQIGSAIFREAQTTLCRQLRDFLSANDLSGTVTHYMPGIEWWFPPSDQYAEKDVAGFRDWLRRKYRTAKRLNAAWGGQYASFDTVTPPGVDYPALYAKERQGLDRISFHYAALPNGPPSPTSSIAVANDWTGYWNEVTGRYINSLARLVKDVDPTRPRASYLTFAWAQAAEWDYVNWSQIRLDSAVAAADDLDIIGMQLCFAAGESYRLTSGFDMARKYGKPMWDMDLLDFVSGVKGGFASHEKNTHAAVQHGANSLFYCCWNGAKDFNFYPDWPIDQINRMVGDARKALELVQGASVVTDCAIVNPIVACAPGDPLFGRNDVRSLMGWYKILERLPKTVDVITLREIENRWVDLKRYRWILVPDCPYISDAALKRLSRYAENGLVVRGGRFADFNENGVARKHVRSPGRALPDYGIEYAGADLPRNVFAGDTPPEMIWRAETDATLQTLGAAVEALRGSLQSANLSDEIAVLSGSQDVRCSVFEGNDYRLLYLVNMGSESAKDVRVGLRDEKLDVTKVYADLNETEPVQRARETLLPMFRTSCIVRLQKH